jgi:hypothetical protein
MPSFNKLIAFKRAGVGLGAFAVVLGAGAWLQTIVRLDPFAGLKQTSKDVDPNLGVRIEGVTLQSYDHEKLVTKATLKRLDVRQDRRHFDLFDVDSGVFYSKEGQIAFDTPRAQWDVSAHELDAPQGAHIKDKNADLQVPHFAFKSDTGDVHAPGAVQGKLYDGTFKAMNVRYNVNKGSFRSGPIEWNGKIALSFQDEDKPAPRFWKFKSEGESYTKGKDVTVYEKAYGTDDEIIVMADLLEHNKKTNVVAATGNVRYFSAKCNMVCEKAVIERDIRKATLVGNVQMLLKEKEKQTTISMEDGIPPYRPIVPDQLAKSRPQAEGSGQTPEQKKLDDEIRSSKNMRDYPTICYAEKIEYWYKKKERHAIITGSPQARQELRDGGWRQVWTHIGYYDGEKETLKLVSSDGQQDTRMINSIGDDGVADWIQLSTKEGDEDWRALHMKATIADYNDEIPRDDSKKIPPLPTTQPVKGTGGGKSGGTTQPKTKPSLNGPIGKPKTKSN